MSTSNTTTDHNPFRENEVLPMTQTGLAPDSPHVGFVARSPSIIPTPVYEESVSEFSTPLSSPALFNEETSKPVHSPSPLGIQTNQSSPISSEDNTNTYQAKTEIGENHLYGPTFRDDDNSQQYDPNAVPTTSAFHRGNFVPQRGDEEEIQLYENTARPLIHPPPEQSRVEIFMSKLKGYQTPTDGNEQHATRGFVKPEDNFGRSAPKQRGFLYRQCFGSATYPFFTYISAIAMFAIFIYELVRNHELSGSWIQTNPFNPMIGPNYMALINMGSKFDPCMRDTTQFPPTSLLANCYATTESTCTVEQVCGFGGFGGQAPNQTFRFFTAIFLHAGVVHILFNLITHYQLGIEIERRIGMIRFMILYFVSGIWGFVLSGVLSGLTVSSMGCSGSLFGLIGFSVTDIIIRWKEIRRPGRELTVLVFTVAISLALGLFPGIDNFAHIGGLVMGLLFGVILTTSPATASKRAILFTWVGRIVCLVFAIVLYVVFLRIFYTASDLSTVCPGCKYLSCLPINGWCDT